MNVEVARQLAKQKIEELAQALERGDAGHLAAMACDDGVDPGQQQPARDRGAMGVKLARERLQAHGEPFLAQVAKQHLIHR